MFRILFLLMALATTCAVSARKRVPADLFPDGTVVDQWFRAYKEPSLQDWTKTFVLTDNGVVTDSTLVQTSAIQKVIDAAAAYSADNQQRSLVVVPAGTFMSGSLFMRPGVSLYLEEGARLKGSADIADYPVVDTRIEGQSCKYFAALVNADRCDGLRIFGRGTIDGNGLSYWRAFWLRRSWNPQCTNKDEQRPRLVYISNTSDVEVSGITLQHSPFWTTHIYRCDHARFYGLRILSPAAPVKAPSTDAIDIDACHDVHVSHCYMSVNDDAIALKGGKGPYADQDENNGANERIIIEDCEYGFCHGCLTCGSESIHSRNVILRRIKVGKATRLLWLKMRPDTPQQYEHIRVEDIEGEVTYFLFVRPWTQFFDLQGRTDMPQSYGRNITMRRCDMTCRSVFEVERSDQYALSDFTFENLNITAENVDFDESQIERCKVSAVELKKK